MRSIGAIARIWIALAALVGCGGAAAPDESSQPTTDRLSACPAGLEATNGAACVDGLMCTVPITCEVVNEQAQCKCTGGVFVCNDAIGVIPVHTAARCSGDSAADDDVCPPSLGEAQDQPCSSVGFSCDYPGIKCPNRVVAFTDYCECKATPSGGKTLQCVTMKCGPAEMP